MIQMWTGKTCHRLPKKAQGETLQMHDLLIGLAFIGMVIAPALVAAHSGSGEPTDETE
jgi:hypothetical protein